MESSLCDTVDSSCGHLKLLWVFLSLFLALLSRCCVSSSAVLHKTRLIIIETKCMQVFALAFVGSQPRKHWPRRLLSASCLHQLKVEGPLLGKTDRANCPLLPKWEKSNLLLLARPRKLKTSPLSARCCLHPLRLPCSYIRYRNYVHKRQLFSM